MRALTSALTVTALLVASTSARAGTLPGAGAGIAGPQLGLAAPPEHEPTARPIKLVVDTGDAPALVPPAPTVEPAQSPQQAPAPGQVSQTDQVAVPQRSVVGKRPISGRGLTVMGVISLGVSGTMVLVGLGGPGWLDLERRRAATIGGLALPLGVIGASMLGGGLSSNKRYQRWQSDNGLHAPDTGGGLLVGGVLAVVGGAAVTGFSVQRVLESDSQARGRWVPSGFGGMVTVLGMLMLAGGMSTRARYSKWEREKGLRPGAMVLPGGGGLSISGRF